MLDIVSWLKLIYSINMMFYLLLRVYNIQYLVIFIMMTRVFLHHPAKDVADAKLVIEMRKEAHSLVEERRKQLSALLHTFQERRMEFVYDRQIQLLLSRGQVEVEVEVMEPIAKVNKNFTRYTEVFTVSM